MNARTANFNPDHLSQHGARMLAERIEKYWEERGGLVRAAVISLGKFTSCNHTFFAVRSNMLNGVPRRRA